MSERRLPDRVGATASMVLALILLVLLVGIAPAVTQTDDGTGEGAAGVRRPPLLAAIVPTGDPSGLAPVSVYRYAQRADGDVTVAIRFAAEFSPPEGHRVAVHLGDPTAEHTRVSMFVQDGQPVGGVDRGLGRLWSPLGETTADLSPDGLVRLRLPAAETAGVGSFWVVVEAPSGGGRFVSSVFPLEQLLGRGEPGVLVPSGVAWIADESGVPTDEAVELRALPELEVVNQGVTVTPADPPADILGVPVSSTVDFVRVSPDASAGGPAPYFVAVDHTGGTVSLWDGTREIPVEIRAPGERWLVEDLDTSAGTSEVVLDRGELLAALGIPLSDEVGFGVARRVALADGREITADGVTATAAWFDESAGAAISSRAPSSPAAAPAAPPPGPVEAEEGSSPSGRGVVIAAFALAAVLVGATIWRARRGGGAAEPTPSPVDGPSIAEPVVEVARPEAEPDRRPRRGRSRRGVTPDEALADLEHTIADLRVGPGDEAGGSDGRGDRGSNGRDADERAPARGSRS